MKQPYENADGVAREIQGQFRPGTDKIVRPPMWIEYAKVRWKHKTAENLAAYATAHGRPCTARTAARWLSGEYDPDLVVALAFAADMFKRE